MRRAIILLVACCVGSLAAGLAAAPQLPKSPEKVLASKLRPLSAGQAGEVPGRLKAILSFMELAERRSPIGGDAVLRRAFNERSDIGPVRKTASLMAISAAWREAQALGAFDENHVFTAKITKGADSGKRVVIEPIVPVSHAPEFAGELANYRIVPPSRARKADEPVSHRDAAVLGALKNIQQEARKMDVVGRHAEGWKRDMEAAGDQANQVPRVRLNLVSFSSPSQKNGDVWQIKVEVTNASDIPCEVMLHSYMIGRLWKDKELCAMQSHSQTLKLRGNEIRTLILATRSRGQCKKLMDDHEKLNAKQRQKSEANYLGSLALVQHNGVTLATSATYNSLLKILDEKQRFPSSVVILSK